ncbi:hypothetical protein B0H12DRAFT_730739 [Mycena haematopus]|nr:hypothetical protein B0H12DRAFT_730739 [Mycena haematopus]
MSDSGGLEPFRMVRSSASASPYETSDEELDTPNPDAQPPAGGSSSNVRPQRAAKDKCIAQLQDAAQPNERNRGEKLEAAPTASTLSATNLKRNRGDDVVEEFYHSKRKRIRKEREEANFCFDVYSSFVLTSSRFSWRRRARRARTPKCGPHCDRRGRVCSFPRFSRNRRAASLLNPRPRPRRSPRNPLRTWMLQLLPLAHSSSYPRGLVRSVPQFSRNWRPASSLNLRPRPQLLAWNLLWSNKLRTWALPLSPLVPP